MTQPYRANEPGGVKIEATGEIIYPGMPEWDIYEAWLGEQPGPAFPGGPLPAGTGLLPYAPPVLNLVQQRTEATARLDSILATLAHRGTVNAVGHTWALTWPFVVAVLVHRATFPPVPAGFTLPDVNRVQVALNNAQLNQLVEAISTRLVLVNTNYAALVAAINASATPLTVNLGAGWP